MSNSTASATEHLLSSEKNAERLRESIAEVKQRIQPTVYLVDCGDSVLLSAYSVDDGDIQARNYTMDIIGLWGAGARDTSSNSMQILRNILERAGVHVVIE